jgi:hypothetical protein
MLDSTPNFIPSNFPSTIFQLGGQWQVFIQTDGQGAYSGDYGGSALWMGQNYGNVPSPPGHGPNDSYSYSNSAWQAEIGRIGLNGTLQAGDLVEIDARGGMFHSGKFNVNEQHNNDAAYNFDVIRLGHPGLPDPTPITLSQIKNADNTFKFSADRTLLTNPEHYQATLVELDGVRLISSAGWGNNASLMLTDGTLTLPLVLGLNGFTMPAPAGTFNVVGIFDQEGSNTGDYRLWVVDASQFAQTVPEPAACVLAALGGAALLAFRLRRGGRRA